MHLLMAVLMMASGGGLEELSWMSGGWAAVIDGTEMEEYWTTPKQGTMVGVHRDVRDGKTQFEFLRIARDKDGVVYYASPGGRQPATEFRLIESRPGRAVFANPKHDFPQRIIYWNDGAKLCARVEGPMKGETVGEEWCWTKNR